MTNLPMPTADDLLGKRFELYVPTLKGTRTIKRHTADFTIVAYDPVGQAATIHVLTVEGDRDRQLMRLGTLVEGLEAGLVVESTKAPFTHDRTPNSVRIALTGKKLADAMEGFNRPRLKVIEGGKQ